VGAGGSLSSGVRPAAAGPPRVSPNHRPFRRSRRSVRPVLETASLIEPWSHPHDPRASATAQSSGAVATHRWLNHLHGPCGRTASGLAPGKHRG
jgi:hypothetical protein